MKKSTLFRLKNMMMTGNFIAIFVGVIIVDYASQRSMAPPPPSIMELATKIDLVFIPVCLVLLTMSVLLYERPIRKTLHMMYHEGIKPPDDLTALARRRLLNEPFFLIGIDLVIWISAAIVYPIIFTMTNAGVMVIGRVVAQTLIAGFLTTIAAFFILEYVLQKHLALRLFPKGGLYMTPKTIRVRIRVRLAALILAGNIFPSLAYLGIIRGSYRVQVDPAELLALLQPAILGATFTFMGIGSGNM